MEAGCSSSRTVLVLQAWSSIFGPQNPGVEGDPFYYTFSDSLEGWSSGAQKGAGAAAA